jgi:thiol-disulfide isomerase/thioredoxin
METNNHDLIYTFLRGQEMAKKRKDRQNKKGRSRTNNNLSQKKQDMKKRKDDIIFFSVLFIIVVGIFGGYFVYDIYLKDANEDSNDDNFHGGSNIDDGNTENDVVTVGINVGQKAPDFELTDIDGKSFELDDYRDYIVILDFMADRCPPCHEEMDHLNEVYSNYYNKGVRILSIGVDDSESAETLNTNVKEAHDCEWRFAAGGGNVGSVYKIEYIPTIYILDTEGKITFKNIGLTDYSALSSEIDKIR